MLKMFSIHPTQCFPIFLLLTVLISCNTQQTQESNTQITKSEIRLTKDGHRIFLNDEPLYVQGAGVHTGSPEALAAHGANALRTWSTQNGEEVLDKAHELGLKVMMGIWIGLERHGFDYDDEAAVKKQMEYIRGRVLALKDHPALMIWGLGNELNHHSTNPKVWEAVNDISEMIHELDPHHLTTTSLAGINKENIDLIAANAPDLDFVSTQLYKPIEVLPQLLQKTTYEGPLLVTEWGATGYWEVDTTTWGAPLENNSSVKADFYLSRYQNAIATQSQVMGSFVFLWGQKQERTPTWFGMFTADGQETESIDVMHYVWNGKWPENRSPRLQDFTLEGQRGVNNIKLKVGDNYSAQVKVIDPDDDPMTYRWEIMEESNSQATGGDREYVPDVLPGLFTTSADSSANFTAPAKSGAYRLFVYVEDGNQHTAHANIPFWVEE